jgi:hypothetical protein
MMGNQAEMMKRLGMIRFHGEDLPVDLLGSLEAASLVVFSRSR